jgi:hypothetical protein
MYDAIERTRYLLIRIVVFLLESRCRISDHWGALLLLDNRMTNFEMNLY